ncbi:hypothetical protein [Microbacterium terregens]|uniref:Uncharacterized protein n=1 Tax=Microbacterium terregens TaxID=69363 RepID=A0ABV5SYJ4_9MICO
MRTPFTRTTLIVAVTAAALLMTACAGATPDDTATGTDVADADSATRKRTSEPTTGDGDGYAFGTSRDQLATALDRAFSTENGKARWEGDTLVLAVDGDASEMMAGFTQCRVLLSLLQADDVSVIEFPNGQVACADALAED